MGDINYKDYFDDKFEGLSKYIGEGMKEIKSDLKEKNETLIKLQLVQSNLQQDFTSSQHANRRDHERYEKNLERLADIISKSDPVKTAETVNDHATRFNEIAGAIKSAKVFYIIVTFFFSIIVSLIGILQYINLKGGN